MAYGETEWKLDKRTKTNQIMEDGEQGIKIWKMKDL